MVKDSFMRNALAYSVMSLLFIGFVGCSDGRVEISGQVTMAGKPLERGTISFLPLDGKGNSAGAKIEDGTYQSKDVLPGKKRVEITAVGKTGKRISAGPMMAP